MDRPYNAFADWLSKFHTWPESIQALWLVAVPATLLGMTWLAMRGFVETVRLLRQGVGDQTTRRHEAQREAFARDSPSSEPLTFPRRHGRT